MTRRTRSPKWVFSFILITSIAFGCLNQPPQPVHAISNIIVNTSVDEFEDPDPNPGDPRCSLREAIELLNNHTELFPQSYGGCTMTNANHVIDLPAYTVYLTRPGCCGNSVGDLTTTTSVDIVGAGVWDSSINGGGSMGIFQSRILKTSGTGLVRLYDMTITGGYTSDPGGAIYVGNGNLDPGNMVLELHDVVLDGNHTTADGGGLYISNEGGSILSVLVDESIIRDNSATQNGGGIYSVTGLLTVSNSIILRNDANGDGGGIWFDHVYDESELVISNTFFDDNRAYGGYGGNLFTKFDTSITDSIFRNGIANFGGGNIYGYNRMIGKTLSIERSEISGGYTGTGGGISMDGEMTLQNVTISGNTAYSGGGIYLADSPAGYPVDMQNITLADNTLTGGDGYAFYKAGENNPLQLYDTILYQDTVFGDTSVCAGMVDPGSSYNIVHPGTCGLSSDISLHNQLGIDPGIGPLTDNGSLSPVGTTGLTYHQYSHAALSKSSPLVDHGNTTGCLPVDQRGYPRPVNGDLIGGAICDVGAYELQMLSFLPLVIKPGEEY